MKHNYGPYCWLFFLLLMSGYAQSQIDHRVTASLSKTTIDFTTRYKTKVIHGSGSMNSYSLRTVIDSPGIGFGIGYQGRFHRRWEVAGRVNYLGNSIKEGQDRFAVRNHLPPELERELDYTRKYRALWLEALLFWKVTRRISAVDIQLGSGITYMYNKHFYLQGYVYDRGLGIFDVKTFVNERKSDFGLPIHFQVQYPINPTLNIGVNTYANIYFEDDLLVGVMVFGAYRW
ncbi:MAG: hypothetical protein AAFR36_04270 [Bacteroidota bacterium]